MAKPEFDTRPKVADLREFCPGGRCDSTQCALVVTEALPSGTVLARVKPEFWTCVQGRTRQNQALGQAAFSAYITKGHDGEPVDKG